MWEPGFIFDWICTFLEIAALLFMSKQGGHLSSRLSLGTWIVANLLMQLAAPQVLLWSQHFSNFAFGIWYGSWIVFNACALRVMVLLHKLAHIHGSRFSLFVSACFFALTFVQIAGYVDHALLETKVLNEAYRYMLLAVNFSVLPMLLRELIRTPRGKGFV